MNPSVLVFILPLQVVVGPEFLAIILSTGAAAMVAAIVQAYRSIRDGAKADEKDAFAEIEVSRKKEAVKRSNAEKLRDYWHRRAGALEFIILRNLGAEQLPPEETLPVLEKEE